MYECYKNTVLSQACYKKNIPLILELIKRGAKVNHSSTRKYISNCEDCHVDIIKVLCDHGLNPRYRYRSKMTLLMHACRKRCKIEIIECLIDIGCQVNAVNVNGDSSLHLIFKPHYTYVFDEKLAIEKVDLLLKRGADPNIKNENGDTPIIYALKKGAHLIVKLLLEYGAHLEVNEDGRVPKNIRSNFKKEDRKLLEYVIFEWYQTREGLKNIKGSQKCLKLLH